MPTRCTAHWLIIVCAIGMLAGCTTAEPGTTVLRSQAPPTASPSAPPSPSQTTSPATTAGAGDAWLLVGREGETDLRVILDSTLEEQIQVPAGVPGDKWGYVYAVTPGSTTTVVQSVVIQPGLGGNKVEIEGRWVSPTIGLEAVPVGVSSDYSTLVLVEADVAHGAAGVGRSTSRFAVLDAQFSLGAKPRFIELDGAFDFDALSPDGSLLYVAEQIPGSLEGRYQVRAVETANGLLRPEVIVDKRNVDEQMAGYPIAQERRSDGMVLTLYRGAEHPFVHALSSVAAWAVCIDLPSRGFGDVDAAADWGIVSAGRADLAINATLGVAVDMDPTELKVRRAVDFAPLAGSQFRLAKFGHGDLGPAGRRVVASPDGSAVFAAGAGGIVRIGARDLELDGRFMTGTGIEALALTPDGATLFALTRSDGRIVRLDASTGEVEGWVGDSGYDRLLGALPW